MEDRLFWIDLETEGLDAPYDGILEVGAAVTDLQLNIIAEKSWIVMPYQGWTIESLRLQNEYVWRMHTASGLLEEVVKKGRPYQEVGNQIRVFCADHKLGQDQSDPICGNSVHFDRTFLKAYWPAINNGFSYRIIDVSSEKEEIRRYHPEWLAELEALPERQVKAHRALDDVRQSIDEFKFYRMKRGDL